MKQFNAFDMRLTTTLLGTVLALCICRAAAQGPQTKFNQIQFVIATGSDDLRGNSSATATLFSPSGATLQVLTLKQKDKGTWGNNSTHTVSVPLNPPRAAADIGRIIIALQTHNDFGQNDDDWNVDNVVVTLSSNGGAQTPLASGSGSPLQRITKDQPLTLMPQPAGPPGTFNQIQFVIGTGGDDLRGDSSATATLQLPNGTVLQVVTLKAKDQGSWDNNTTHTVSVALNPPRSPADIGHIVITLDSHKQGLESDDNWNVQSVTVNLLNNGGGAKRLMSFADNPLARLTASKPSVTLPLVPAGPPGTFNQIQFVIGTGGDDLRGDSSATATLQSPNGTVLQVVTLKAKDQGSWDNNTTHTVSVALNPPRSAAAIGHIVITLQSHNNAFETDDNWNVQAVAVTLWNNGVGQTTLMGASGNPLQRLTGTLPSLVLDNPNGLSNVIGPQPGNGKLKGFVDLHTHPLSSLGFGGKLVYGGVDVGSLLPADPECKKNVRALCMQQALGHDGSTHGSWGVNLGESSGDLGIQNNCGDLVREQVIHSMQKSLGAPDPSSSDLRGAPDFVNWPTWNDLLHQKMWVDWVRRAYCGGLRVIVALGVNNKTLGDMVAGPGDLPTDDKSSADLQIVETKAFVQRHSDFMEVAYSPADLERIVRGNKLAVVLGLEVDNIGNFNKLRQLNDATTKAEIDRLYAEGIRYIFPIHLLDNRFGGTAVYEDLFNYSTFRESGHWWDLGCSDSSIGYTFIEVSGLEILFAKLYKIGPGFAFGNPPGYAICANGQTNRLGLIPPTGEFAIKEMMRHGMIIDIDHMSEFAQNKTIEIAQNVGGGYPLNSGHSGLRGFLPVPSGTFNKIQFVIETGGDDLRGDSSATATLVSTSGSTIQTFTLKDKNEPSWGNNSTKVCSYALNPPLMGSKIGSLNITLTSHNSLTETDDNWNIESVRVVISTDGGCQTVLALGTGDPLARLTKKRPTWIYPMGTERNMNAAQYSAIAKLHGMAGIGTGNLNAYQWVEMYQKVIEAMGTGAAAGFGTDTDGLAPGMPPRPCSAVHYDDSFPRSSLGTKWWDYNRDGVAHYGMLPDFLQDARTAPGGGGLIDTNLMYGADYFLQTWKQCESEKSNVH